jgi:CubicO group peptidase (beta-lactamase class C family)
MSGSVVKIQDKRFKKICSSAFSRMKTSHIPGAVIGVLHGNMEYYAPFGVVSLENPLPVTEDTLFKIASISKTFLATAAVMLVEKGVLDLDSPVKKYLPELKLSDKSVEEGVSMRHLLTHTSGWYGDYFNDFGRGDDALAKMVDKMADLPQLSPLGKIFSYSNSGFYLAARVIEVVTGKTFEAAIKEMVLEPLEMRNSFYFADEVIVHRFAIGHQRVKGKLCVAKPWARPRSASATGGIICSVKDLLRYARFHMGDGRLTDGTRLLSEESMRLLHTPTAEAFGNKKIALSWFCGLVDGKTVLVHGGGTMGQACELRIIPSEKLAIAVLTNSSAGGALLGKIFEETYTEYLGYIPSIIKPMPASKEVLLEYTGRFSNPGSICEIKLEGNSLRLYMTDTGGFPTPKDLPKEQPQPARIALCAKDKLLYVDGPLKGSTGDFVRDSCGNIEWLRFSRAMKKEKKTWAKRPM